MKKGLVIAFSAMLSLNIATTVSAAIYPDCGLVTEIKQENAVDTDEVLELITITMQNGNMFAFLSDSGDWYVGDLAAVIMDNMETDTVYDDEILDAKYIGWISHNEMKQWVKSPY